MNARERHAWDSMKCSIHGDNCEERLCPNAIRSHFEEFTGFVLTCKRNNTDEWMRLLLDHVNGVIQRFSDTQHATYDGSGFTLHTPGTTLNLPDYWYDKRIQEDAND